MFQVICCKVNVQDVWIRTVWGEGGGFLVIITYSSSILFWGAPYDKYSIIRRQVQEGESSASAMRRPSGPRTALHS